MSAPKLPDPILPEHAEPFLLAIGARSARTTTSYRSALRVMQQFAEASQLTPAGLPLAPSALRPTFLADFYSWLRQAKYVHPLKNQPPKKYENATLRLYLAAAKRFIGWLEAQDQLAANLHVSDLQERLRATSGRGALKATRRQVDESLGALLSYYADQLAQAEAADEPITAQQRLVLLRNHALLQVLYTTAARAAEVVALQRDQVADGYAVRVEVTGKGNKPRALILLPPAQQALRRYLSLREDDAPALFISHGAHAGNRLNSKTLWAIVNAAAHAIYGVNSKGHPRRRVGPHLLRHLRAEQLLAQAMPLTSLQKMLGHESIATTRDIYAPTTSLDQLEADLKAHGLDLHEVQERGRRALKKRGDSAGK